MKTISFAACLLALALLAGCTDREAAEAARAQAQAAANESAAAQAEVAFEAAVADENWGLAKAQADILFASWPGTRAAERVRERYEEVKAKGDAEAEARRVARCGRTSRSPSASGSNCPPPSTREGTAGRGRQREEARAADLPRPSRMGPQQLRCCRPATSRAPATACRVSVTVDDAAPRRMAANRPNTDEAIAMFIDDEKALWRLTRDAKVVRIEFETRDAGAQTALFEVAGLERTRLPGWD